MYGIAQDCELSATL